MVSRYPAWEPLLFGLRGAMANIWDRFGRLIGSVKKSGEDDLNTYDHKGQPLGKVRRLGTYEIGGNKISSTRDPGLTFCKRK